MEEDLRECLEALEEPSLLSCAGPKAVLEPTVERHLQVIPEARL